MGTNLLLHTIVWESNQLNSSNWMEAMPLREPHKLNFENKIQIQQSNGFEIWRL